MPRRAPAPPELFSRRLGAIVGATLASVTLASTALGDKGRAYRIAYVAPLACPTAADFEARIRSSTERARPARGDEPAVELTIDMVAQADGFAGELTVRHPDGSAATRSIPAESCVDAVAAVAFVAAIILDPNARPPAASTGEAEAPVDGTPPTPTAPPTQVPTRAPAPEPAPPAAARARRRVWLGVHGEAGVVGAMAPSLSPDFGVGLDAGAARESALAPEVSLSGHFAPSAQVDTARGSATFERWSARLTGCPLQATVLGRLVLRPCGWFEVGSLRARGLNTVDRQIVSVLWTALGATGRAEILLGGRFTLGGEAGGIFPLIRDSFYFTPDGTRASKVAGAGWMGSISLGLRIL